MFFSNTHWPQLTAPFYSILFETSICQFNSSKFSPIMPDEVREHLTRDQRPFLHPESLQILQIHSSITVLLLSVHLTHFLQGSGQRTGMAIAEAWFCTQWPICVIFEVCVWIIVRLEDPNMAHSKISNRVISDAMCLNKMSRTLQQKYRPTTSEIQQYISLYTWGTFYPCVHQTHLECLLLKS